MTGMPRRRALRFAIARTVGWIGQWKATIEDPSQRIGSGSSIPARSSVPISQFPFAKISLARRTFSDLRKVDLDEG